MLIIVGIFAGFGKSPYAFTPVSIGINAIFVGSFLIGTELSRSYLIKKGANARKYTTLALGLITLLYIIIQIKPSTITSLSLENPEFILEFVGGTIIVLLSMNLLASYLSYLGGASASLGYMGILLIFEWFSPILPDPHWTVLALVGTIAPAVGFVIIQDSLEPLRKKRGLAKRKKKETSDHGWTVVAIFSVILVFFSFGYLGVEPTVIYSGSMEPSLDVGDISMIQEVDVDTIAIGDIIQFIRDNTSIVHRVHDITEVDGQNVFITKGDANDDPDLEPITAQQITGKSVFIVPKIGWIQIVVKNAFQTIGIPA
jgi:signal peptidase